jgi:hypothetical protein
MVALVACWFVTPLEVGAASTPGPLNMLLNMFAIPGESLFCAIVFAIADANCFIKSGFVFITCSNPGKFDLNIILVR